MTESIESLILKDPKFRKSRLESLYSNFNHLKESNPEGYVANILDWKSLLFELKSKHSEFFDDKISFDTNELTNQLSLPSLNLKPKGLDKVLNYVANEEKVIIPYSSFKNRPIKESRGALGNLFGLVFGSPSSSINLSAGKETGDLVPDERIIVIDQLTFYSGKLKDYIKKENHSPILYKHLHELIESDDSFDLSEFDFNCCLKYLYRDLQAVVISHRDSDEGSSVIRLNARPLKGETQLTEEQVKSIADLKYAIYKISQYNDQTSDRIAAIDYKLKEAVKNKQMIKAKSQLKIKKALESKLVSSNNNLENLSLVLMKIEETNSNAMTVKALESNSTILRHLNDQIGNIEETLEEINTETDRIDDISLELSKLTVKENLDDELEDELEQMRFQEVGQQHSKTPATNENQTADKEPEEDTELTEETMDVPSEEALLARFNRLKRPVDSSVQEQVQQEGTQKINKQAILE